MNFFIKHKNDIIYLLLLLFSVFIGGYYKKIETINAKKWFGTVIGITLICIVSHFNSIHLFITVAIGIAVIKLTPKSICHVISFFTIFGYLFFFRFCEYFGFSAPSGQSNLIEMILVLRIVGVAFEVNGSWLFVGEAKKDETQEKLRDDDYTEMIDPTAIDLVHYCFNYIGLLTGPYYRYRTFDDHYKLPFSKSVDCYGATLNSVRFVPIYVSLYIVISTIWPLNYVETDEFASRSFFYRAMYPWALFAQFRMRIYSGMTLAECVCTAAGLGAYPVDGRNRTGHGPTVNYHKIKEITTEQAKGLEYDFKTVVSVEAYDSEVIPLFRDSMKVWNKAVQYWVGMYVYKRFPVKLLRMHVALFVSVLWHGFHAGYFFCIFFSPFYVMAEDIYVSLLSYRSSTGIKSHVLNLIFWFLRVHYQSYQTAAFLLLTFDRVWKFYTLMNHYLYFIWIVMLTLGFLLKTSSKSSKRTRDALVTERKVIN